MKSKRDILNVTVLFVLLIFTINTCNLDPGSYPNAELYKIEINEDRLIQAIKEFKEKNPKYIVPEDIPLLDGRRNSKDHWYHFYFFDSKRNQTIKTWVRGSGMNEVNFALIAIYDPNFVERWKFVNRDFDRELNKQIKNRFENDILKPVIKILHKPVGANL